MMQKTANVSIFLAVGILILGLGIFARQFGLDPSPGWGKGRIGLLFLGLGIAALPWLRRKSPVSPDRVAHNDLFTLPVLLLVLGTYFWFITISQATTSNYYSLLASSFRNGELSLPLKPDPALLQLPDPYDPAARQGIKVPLDLSLYNGKFYLYWGPAPSLLLALVQPFIPGKIGEVDLMLLFLSGIFLSQYRLIMHIRERFVPRLPRWLLLVSILLAGFANPALWLLSQPKIYEAAIAGAQFFFMAGLLAAVTALDRQTPSRWGLALAGTCWALAVGTRSVAAFSVLFMTLMVVYRLFKLQRHFLPGLIGELIPLSLPLFLGALGFAWYNRARFGSVLETGFTYQLAGPHLQKHLNDLFLPGYIVQNFYNYVLNPVAVRLPFPFLYPLRGQIESILPGQLLPEFYTAQAITGFLVAVPFVVFAIPPLVSLVQQLAGKDPAGDSNLETQALSLSWIITSLLGSFLLPFLSLLAFFWAAMRYAEDFMPALTLLSILGFWQVYCRNEAKPHTRQFYGALGGILAGLSIAAALLLALSTYFTGGLLGK